MKRLYNIKPRPLAGFFVYIREARIGRELFVS